MINCPQCNQKIPDDAQFCPFCGGKIDATVLKEDPPETLSSDQEKTSDSSYKKESSAIPEPPKTKYIMPQGLKTFLGWIAVIFFLSLFCNRNSNQSSQSTYTPSAGIYVHDGMYHCSDYNKTQADLLKPSESDAQSIENDRVPLNSRLDELNSLMAEINAMGVTSDSPQYLIDSYNAKIADYNSKLASYQSDLQEFNNRVNAYKASRDAYNNYLEANCSK